MVGKVCVTRAAFVVRAIRMCVACEHLEPESEDYQVAGTQ